MWINNIVQDGDRKKIQPIQKYTSPVSAISLGSPIFFNHDLFEIDLSKSLTVTVFLVCAESELGYQAGDAVTPDSGVSVQLKDDRFIVRPSDSGVRIIDADKDRGKSEKIKPQRWYLFLTSILI